jgi:hypothetical protein
MDEAREQEREAAEAEIGVVGEAGQRDEKG